MPLRSLRLSACIVAFVGLTAAIAGTARAERTCAARGRPIVELTVESGDDRGLRDGLVEHAVAELSARGIDVCTEAASAPVARLYVTVLALEGQDPRATMAVEDTLTRKRVERTMELRAMPSHMRAIAIASAADELLRATWAELELRDAPRPDAPPPREVVRAVTSSVARRDRAPTFELGVAGVASAFPTNRDAMGGELSAVRWFADRVGVRGLVGTDFGFARSSEHGSAKADSVFFGGGVAVGFTPVRAAWGMGAWADVSAVRVAFEGTPAPGAFGNHGSLWTGLASGGLEVWGRKDAWRWGVGVGAAMPFAPARASDEGRTVTSLEGLGVIARLGVRYALERGEP